MNDKGHVLVAVCSREDFLGSQCAYSGRAPAKPGTVIATVSSVSPGRYAIHAFHDENDNLKIDRFSGV
jgi:uncharacterized protein (DUF2141 family)